MKQTQNSNIEYVEVNGINLEGKSVTLKGVPAEYSEKMKDYLIDLQDLVKAEGKQIAESVDVSPRQIHPLLLVYVTPKYETQITIGKVRGHPIKESFLDQKFRLNKMLFCAWKELEKISTPQLFEFDEFGAARAGPVPKMIKEDLKELEQKGLMMVTWAHRPGESYQFELTSTGKIAAKQIWNNLPREAKEVFIKIKNDLFLISAEELKHKIHALYPEYRKVYVDLDEE